MLYIISIYIYIHVYLDVTRFWQRNINSLLEASAQSLVEIPREVGRGQDHDLNTQKEAFIYILKKNNETYTYIYIYTHTHTHTHIYIYIYIYIYMYIYIHASIYTYIHLYINKYIHTYIYSHCYRCSYRCTAVKLMSSRSQGKLKAASTIT